MVGGKRGRGGFIEGLAGRREPSDTTGGHIPTETFGLSLAPTMNGRTDCFIPAGLSGVTLHPTVVFLSRMKAESGLVLEIKTVIGRVK